jgi:hypothetical protein
MRLWRHVHNGTAAGPWRAWLTPAKARAIERNESPPIDPLLEYSSLPRETGATTCPALALSQVRYWLPDSAGVAPEPDCQHTSLWRVGAARALRTFIYRCAGWKSTKTSSPPNHLEQRPLLDGLQHLLVPSSGGNCRTSNLFDDEAEELLAMSPKKQTTKLETTRSGWRSNWRRAMATTSR